MLKNQKRIENALAGALVTGAPGKQFSQEQVIVMAVDYLYKGALTEDHVIWIIGELPYSSRNG